MRVRRSALTVALSIALPHLPLQADVFRGRTMGTTYQITYQPDKKTPAKNVLKAKVDELLRVVNQSMSTYIEDSEINRFNRMPPKKVVKISPHFAAVSVSALRIAKASKGAFDPTIGPLLRVFAVGAGTDDSRLTWPPAAEIKQAQQLIGYQKLKLTKATKAAQWTLAKTQAGVELDYSAIAKGYGVDVVYETLRAAGVRSLLVEIGGELRASAYKDERKKLRWRVGIERPDGTRRPMLTLPLADHGVATSGNYRNFRKVGGKRVGHVLNAQRGGYFQTNVASVSVVAKDCMTADAWATALLSLPQKASLALARKHGIAAAFVVVKENQLSIQKNPGYARYESSVKASL